MLKVVTFMKQVATGLQVEGNFGTAHVYRSSLITSNFLQKISFPLLPFRSRGKNVSLLIISFFSIDYSKRAGTKVYPLPTSNGRSIIET